MTSESPSLLPPRSLSRQDSTLETSAGQSFPGRDLGLHDFAIYPLSPLIYLTGAANSGFVFGQGYCLVEASSLQKANRKRKK